MLEFIGFLSSIAHCVLHRPYSTDEDSEAVDTPFNGGYQELPDTVNDLREDDDLWSGPVSNSDEQYVVSHAFRLLADKI